MADVLVGITMRVLRDPASGESRDALAQDWAHFFNALFPGRPWLMLPNTGEACPALAQDLGVNALVLSGGDDIGMTPLRDATETALLRWAASTLPSSAQKARGSSGEANRAGRRPY